MPLIQLSFESKRRRVTKICARSHHTAFIGDPRNDGEYNDRRPACGCLLFHNYAWISFDHRNPSILDNEALSSKPRA